ncbi:GAF and ANTAR domain-containing protein [Umezawaea sp. Da 62-37]|uniref:ANTAR domain-containing response regulator n=1 Tax=Umezawaea sp. Da 62-37 TaxID=3075927 RepID=UPI0028F6D466|nr:GAF and ANTAR domain-containing protein [Umezawaea sp. Da 62-37]WNV88727.1 GAF and ANTAR domain-containing protein [Umezawaea sp. Da 62-37]
MLVSINEVESAARLDEASAALEDLQGVLASEESIQDALQGLAEAAVRVIADAGAVTITIVDGENASTAASTSEDVIRIDADQYASGDGPCLEAAHTLTPVRVAVGDAGQRWPKFAETAEQAGVRAYLSAPLAVGEDVLGSLNVYGYTDEAFDPYDEALLRLFTTAASGAITAARRSSRSRQIIENLTRALVSRAEIDQAKGALMAVHGVEADAAFQRLVDESQTTNTKLVEVARRLMESLRRE